MFIIRGETMSLLQSIQRLCRWFIALIQVTCDTKELRQLVNDWLSNEGFKFYDFITILNLVGISTPVKLRNLHDKNVFECEDKYGQTFTITLRFGDWIDNCSEIVIKSEKETLVYIVYQDPPKNIKIKLDQRGLETEDKEVWSFYGEYFVWRKLSLGGGKKLEIHIDVPDKYNRDQDEARKKSMQNYLELEQFLINLPEDFSLKAVVEEYMTILAYSVEEIKKCEKIDFYYYREERGKKVFIERIKLVDEK